MHALAVELKDVVIRVPFKTSPITTVTWIPSANVWKPMPRGDRGKVPKPCGGCVKHSVRLSPKGPDETPRGQHLEREADSRFVPLRADTVSARVPDTIGRVWPGLARVQPQLCAQRALEERLQPEKGRSVSAGGIPRSRSQACCSLKAGSAFWSWPGMRPRTRLSQG